MGYGESGVGSVGPGSPPFFLRKARSLDYTFHVLFAKMPVSFSMNLLALVLVDV